MTGKTKKRKKRQRIRPVMARAMFERSILEGAMLDDLSSGQQDEALKHFDSCCAFCGANLAVGHRWDHLVPVKKLGGHTRKNVVPACPHCDDSKQKSDYKEWMHKKMTKLGKSAQWIEEQIKRIDAWAEGYRPPSMETVFGKNINEFEDLKTQMGTLQKKADALIGKIKKERLK